MKQSHSLLGRWALVGALAVAATSSVPRAGLAPALAAPAQVPYWSSGRTLTVEPKMNFVPNSDVYYLRKAPEYGLYRLADTWYLVDEGNWFRAESWRGPFAPVAFSDLPEELSGISEAYRRHWGVGGTVPPGETASPRTFSRKPKMARVTTTGVSYAVRMQDFDLYRYRSTWYLVEGGDWFRSESWRGPFLSVASSSVPRDVRNVPAPYRRHWLR